MSYGGVSHQLGKNTSLIDINAAMENESDVFKDSLKRMVDHLTANEVDINAGAAITLGADLKFNLATEQVTNNEKANQMMSREFRAGHEVPNLQLKSAS